MITYKAPVDTSGAHLAVYTSYPDYGFRCCVCMEEHRFDGFYWFCWHCKLVVHGNCAHHGSTAECTDCVEWG